MTFSIIIKKTNLQIRLQGLNDWPTLEKYSRNSRFLDTCVYNEKGTFEWWHKMPHVDLWYLPYHIFFLSYTKENWGHTIIKVLEYRHPGFIDSRMLFVQFENISIIWGVTVADEGLQIMPQININQVLFRGTECLCSKLWNY